jgi:exodeoxyribonuclease-5
MLSDEQLCASQGIIRSVRGGQEAALTGLAGTGKTTTMKFVYDELVKFGVPVCPMCPTAKAAMVLTKKGVPATTIHRIIYDFRGHVENDDGDLELIFKPKSGKLRYGVFLVDEGSMLTTRQVADIRAHGLPVIWVGDPGQLPPVKSATTDVFRISNLWNLKTIHRQALGSPIIQYAHRLRGGASLSETHAGIRHVAVNGRGADGIVEDMQISGVDRIVVKTNQQRIALNAAYRKSVGRSGVVAPGEEIVCLANNRQLGVVNGEMLRVLDVEAETNGETRIKVLSEIGWRASMWVKNSQFGSVGKSEDEYDPGVLLADYAYALTCHKMQGSSAPHIGVTAKGFCGDSTAWNYTAATRAEDNLTIYY